MRIEDIPKPAITDPRDIILKVTTTTVCGSDLHMYYDKIPGQKAMEEGDILLHAPPSFFLPYTFICLFDALLNVLGHEFMGIVESVGPQVRNLKVGERVVVSAVIACGECMYVLYSSHLLVFFYCVDLLFGGIYNIIGIARNSSSRCVMSQTPANNLRICMAIVLLAYLGMVSLAQ